MIAPCTRTGKDVANHLVCLPCFTGEETEAKGGKATCPRSHSQCWEGWLWNLNLPALMSAQYANSLDVVKLWGSLCCPCSLLLTARPPLKHRASKGHGPDLEGRPPAKLRHLLFLNTWKLISGCFLNCYLSPLHLRSPLPTPLPPVQERAALHLPEAGSQGSSSCRGKPACPAQCLHSANGGWMRILPPILRHVHYRCSLGY